jgi:hypothetical protein
MSAEPLPTPGGSPGRVSRVEGLTRSVLGRPVLALVPTPARARRAPFVALLLGIGLLGLVGLLLLNTASAQDAFRLHRLQASAANVTDDRQALSEQVNRLTGPGGLAQQAQQLGMVPGGPPAFWAPGTPLPPGARILDGLVIVPAPRATTAAAASAAAPASVPADPAKAAVTAVPRPGQKAAAAQPTAKTTSKTTSKPSARPSNKAASRASTTSKPATATQPSTSTSTSSGATGSGRSATGRTATGKARTTAGSSR